MLRASNNAEWVRACHYMGTRSLFKPTCLHWLFWVAIDFLTKAMTSLISPLVCHLTQMGSLAEGSDNNSGGCESGIGWINHKVHFAANGHYMLEDWTGGHGAPRTPPCCNHQTAALACTDARRCHSFFPPSLNLNLIWGGGEKKSTDRFSVGFFQNKSNSERGIIFLFNPGAPA